MSYINSDVIDFSAYEHIPARPVEAPNGALRAEYKNFVRKGTSLNEASAQITDSFSKGVMERKMTHEANQITSAGAKSKNNVFNTIAEKAQGYIKKGIEFVKAHKVASAIAAGAVVLGGIIAGVAIHNSKKANKTEKVDANA